MAEEDNLLLERINSAVIECPFCEDMYGYEDYTCAHCMCQGGQGHINIIEYLQKNPKAACELLPTLQTSAAQKTSK